MEETNKRRGVWGNAEIMIDQNALPSDNYADSHPVLKRILSRPEKSYSLADSIAEAVGLAIIKGQLAPGDDLNTVDLSRRFETSRTPVREALLRLEGEGLVEIIPRRRPRVAQLGSAEVAEINLVRANLFVLVAELIVATASDEAIRSLEPHLNQMEAAVKADDGDSHFWGNVTFHDTETAICGNSTVKRILDSLMLRVLRLRYSEMYQPGYFERSLAAHRLVLRAYKERDAALAVAVKSRPIRDGLARLQMLGRNELKSGNGNETHLIDHEVLEILS
jgi:DNA-binding GntR family transcriptional regulator